MSDRRVELILRVPNLTPELADRVQKLLAGFGKLSGASLSRIERDHFADHAVHVSREKVV